jgi:hypothetical protein
VPAPLTRLPWDLAKDEFGAQGADFLGAFGRLLVRTYVRHAKLFDDNAAGGLF